MVTGVHAVDHVTHKFTRTRPGHAPLPQTHRRCAARPCTWTLFGNQPTVAVQFNEPQLIEIGDGGGEALRAALRKAFAFGGLRLALFGESGAIELTRIGDEVLTALRGLRGLRAAFFGVPRIDAIAGTRFCGVR